MNPLIEVVIDPQSSSTTRENAVDTLKRFENVRDLEWLVAHGQLPERGLSSIHTRTSEALAELIYNGTYSEYYAPLPDDVVQAMWSHGVIAPATPLWWNEQIDYSRRKK